MTVLWLMSTKRDFKEINELPLETMLQQTTFGLFTFPSGTSNFLSLVLGDVIALVLPIPS
jgi:hypothetical protein